MVSAPRYSDRVRFVTGLVAAALMVALAGCAGSREVAVPSPTPTGADCLVPVPSAISDLQDDIAATSGATAFNGYGVAAGDEMWFIALSFDADGASHTGVWGTLQDPTDNDDIAYVAVDEVAEASGTYKQPVAFDGVGVLLEGAQAATACID